MEPTSSAIHPIFVSYSHRDRERVRVLVDALWDEGFSVFWDENLDAGEHWLDKIPEALEKAAAVVVLWTRASVVSDGVRKEVAWVEGRSVLVPVLFEGGIETPAAVRDLQRVDLCGWSGDRSPDYVHLIESLHVKVDAARTRESEELQAEMAALRAEGDEQWPVDPEVFAHGFDQQESAISTIMRATLKIREAGEVLLDRRPVTVDVIATLDEVGKTCRAVDRAIKQFIAPAYDSGPIDHEPFDDMAHGSLALEILRGRGHCTRILALYRRHLGLRDSLRSRVSHETLLEIDTAFDRLGVADGGLFEDLGVIGYHLGYEAARIAQLLASGGAARARERIRRGREHLAPLRRQLTAAIAELQRAEQALGHAAKSVEPT